MREQSKMTNKPNIGVMISGQGSNLQAIMDAAAQGSIDANVALVLSNRPQAYGLTRAQKKNIPTVCIDHKEFANRRDFEKQLIQAIQAHQIDLICLAGFMRLLSGYFLENVGAKVINIHPSLLPAYPGLNAIEKAHKDQPSYTGVTVHWVDQGMDTGQVILQQKLAMTQNESLEELTARMHALEHQLYVQAIDKIITEGFIK
jgi:phosphoribosylglycinamide formyltransferase-1